MELDALGLLVWVSVWGSLSGNSINTDYLRFGARCIWLIVLSFGKGGGIRAHVQCRAPRQIIYALYVELFELKN